MHSIIKAACLCLIVSISSSLHAGQKVRIVVHIPSSTKTESVHLAGSLPSVGGWKADGLKLTRQENGTYSTDIDLPTGTTLEFKFTRGSWASVEKNADGSDRPNRQVVIDATTKQIDATVERWATSIPSPVPTSTVVGTLKLHTIDSRFLKQPRKIRVWLPPGYDPNANERYSVLYMHDGQNCFDRQTSAFGNEWEIDESLTKLIADKRIPPIIGVGVDNGLANRINELTYNADAKRGGGQGNAYADFLLNEVKPFVEKNYRAKPDRRHTFIGGSSLGGLASLEIARRHPDAFGGVIAMSPTIWWADESLLKEIDNDPRGLAHTHVWIDMGTQENIPAAASGTSKTQSQQSVDDARRLDEILTKHHIDHKLVIDGEHAEHNEPAWASRFPQAIAYLLSAK